MLYIHALTLAALCDILVFHFKGRAMGIITRINWVDVVAVIIMLRISYVAFHDGLSREIFPLIGSIITLTVSLYYYKKIASSIAGMPAELLNFLAFVVLIIAIGFICKLIKFILDKIIKVTWHPLIERLGGLFAGIARAAIITCIVVTAISLMPLSYLQHSVRERSISGMYFLKIGPYIYSKTAAIVPVMKGEELFAGVDAMTKDLAADKSVLKKVKKKKKEASEWEEEV